MPRGYAMYFSRATIPWARDAFARLGTRCPTALPLYRHYGLYAYRVVPARVSRRSRRRRSSASRRWSSCARCGTATGSRSRSRDGTPAPGIDTPEDLARVRALYSAGGRVSGRADRRSAMTEGASRAVSGDRLRR